MAKKLPIIIQTIIFRIKEGKPQFLLLKRNESRGGFWNTVNGTMEINENVIQCRKREVAEETGIRYLSTWSDELYRFSFNYKGDPMIVIIFSAQARINQKIKINEEHTKYGWFDFNRAVEILKFDDDKKGLTICYNSIKINKKDEK
ncbi:MAG: NUDIX domain-containing protein [Bacteroidales bacterium]